MPVSLPQLSLGSGAQTDQPPPFESLLLPIEHSSSGGIPSPPPTRSLSAFIYLNRTLITYDTHTQSSATRNGACRCLYNPLQANTMEHRGSQALSHQPVMEGAKYSFTGLAEHRTQGALR